MDRLRVASDDVAGTIAGAVARTIAGAVGEVGLTVVYAEVRRVKEGPLPDGGAAVFD